MQLTQQVLSQEIRLARWRLRCPIRQAEGSKQGIGAGSQKGQSQWAYPGLWLEPRPIAGLAYDKRTGKVEAAQVVGMQCRS